MRRANRLVVALAIAGAASAAAAAPVAAAQPAPRVIATFKGRTSQGKAIKVQYLKAGTTRYIRFRTVVVGACPVQRQGVAHLSERVADQAHGTGPVPAKWHWETSTATYDIRIDAKVKRHRRMSGRLAVTWQTAIDNASTCTTPTIHWRARRR